jgi:16S rRNA (guanine527-N7)-methyltransferase
MNGRAEYPVEPFIKSLEQFGLNPDEIQIRRFMQYYEILVDWNKSVNLTAITDFDEVMMKHFADSAAFAILNEPVNGKSLIDVGTGAGFPGIPLKILFPELKVTLLDSLQKRVSFLNEVIERLGLEDIHAVHMRAEEAGRNIEYREQFDYCVSRAVANLAVLSELCIPLIKKNGIFVSYKAADSDQELINAAGALSLLNAKIENRHDVMIQYKDNVIKRRLITIKKNGPTSEKYPRKAGIPSKRPLK